MNRRFQKNVGAELAPAHNFGISPATSTHRAPRFLLHRGFTQTVRNQISGELRFVFNGAKSWAEKRGVPVKNCQPEVTEGMPRRDFLRNSMLLALPVVMGTAAASITTGGHLAATQAVAVYVPPSRSRGSAVLDVSNYGARGDGIYDDTAAIQATINALPSAGGTVFVPAGTYLIDAVRSVNLRSLMHLQLDPGAKLVAKPTSAESYNVVFADAVQDVEISGGQIVGERDQHRGTTGEGGHGIRIRGSARATIRDILISNGWGDGITVGPLPVYQQPYLKSTDVVVANVVCTGNRRNGLSIGNVIGMKVYDSEFSNTYGTSPQCGIDIEPSKGVGGDEGCDQVWIENCLLRGNAHYGMNVWKRVSNLTLTKCIIEKNGTCGLVTRGLTGATFSDNMIQQNASTGLYFQDGTTDVGISGNTFFNNYTKQGYIDRTDFTMTGITTGIRKDLILGKGTANIRVGTNYYK